MIGRIGRLLEIEIFKTIKQPFLYVSLTMVIAVTMLSAMNEKHRFDITPKGPVFSGQNCMVVASSHGLFVGGLFLMVFGAYSLSHEAGSGVFRMVLVRPFARWEYYIAKVLLLLLYTLLIYYCALMTAYLAGGIYFGYGDIIDPVEIGAPPYFTQAQIRSELWNAYLLTFIPFFTLATLGLFLANFSEKSGIAVGLCVGVFALFEICKITFEQTAPLLFVSYTPPVDFSAQKTINPLAIAEMCAEGHHPPAPAAVECFSCTFSQTQVSVAFLVATIVLGCIIFSRKDIQN